MKKIFAVFVICVILVLSGYWIVRVLKKSQLDESISTGAGQKTVPVRNSKLAKQRELIWEYHEEEGNEKTVIEFAQRYLKKVPEDEDIYIILAENYMWSDKLDKAEKAVKQALSINSKSTWALRAFAEIYRVKAEKFPNSAEKYLSKAQSQIEEALSVDAEDPWVNKEAALVYLDKGEKQESLNKINKALKVELDNEYFLSIKEKILSEDNIE